MKKIHWLVATILLSTMTLQAQAAVDYEKHKLNFIGQMGINFGGDELAEADVTDGWGGDFSDSIDAGSGLSFTAGALSELRYVPVDIQFSMGFHFDSIYGTDDHDEIDFSRMLAEGLVFYRTGKHRIGGGLSWHSRVEFEYDVDNVYFTEEFDDTMALVAEYRYRFHENFAFGLRYVAVDYDLENGSQSFGGNHMGLMVSIIL